ncbi:arylamine N-acetyltransferase 2-like [Notolabrus celidotus]|uniref:arylamine N-acetyltransferase 2-like n=1 Tax=Notolabrus celidotus TaxID=1203425 RepID=UPI0014900D5A|nr:arylamine N-acetyltransferase 2-like [Notolabrus celidotus]
MDVETYLTRIGFSGPSVPSLDVPSLDVLQSIHLLHQLSVPFENLTVHSGGRVHVDLPLWYQRIVQQHRGGLCYENNGLFSWLLDQLGYRVTLLSAQIKSGAGFYGPPFEHLIPMVTLGGQRWLCDVGSGRASFTSPLSLETSTAQEQGHRVYRIRQDGDLYFLEWQQEENRGPDGDWAEMYKFTLDPRSLEDFAEMCEYHQSSPCSVIFCKSFCTVLKPGGRLTFVGHRLTSATYPSEGKELETRTRELSDEEIPGVLVKQFGIVLTSPLIPKDETVTPPPDLY